jgi:hypothetical protein
LRVARKRQRSILFLEFPHEFFLPVCRQLFQFGLQLGHRALEPGLIPLRLRFNLLPPKLN